MPRSYLVAAAIAFLLLPAAAQQRPGTNQNTKKELTIRVSFESGEPVEMGIRVQLLTGSGTPVNDTFTDDRGNARFMVDAGQFKVRITGHDIEEMAMERSFSIDPRQMQHTEFVTVRKKPSATDQQSLQTHVSAAMLGVPDKARNECDKGYKALFKKDFAKAKVYLEKATAIYPKYAEAFNGLGVIAMNTGDPAGGRSHFEKAIAVDPEYPAAFVNLSKILMQDKDYAAGEEMLTKAVSLDPLNPEAMSLLSFFQLQTGKYDAAINSAMKAHQMPHERYAMVHFIAASAYEAQRQIPDAIREYKVFLQESPQNSVTAQRVKATLGTLEAQPR